MKEKCCKCGIAEADISFEDNFYCQICFMSTRAKENDQKRERNKGNEETKKNNT